MFKFGIFFFLQLETDRCTLVGMLENILMVLGEHQGKYFAPAKLSDLFWK